MAMSYSKEDIKKAFTLYAEIRSASRVSDVIGIPHKTVDYWKNKFKWDEKLDKKQAKEIACTEEDISKEVAKISSELQLPPHESEMLTQVKTIEGICIATVSGKTQDLPEGTMKPVNFDSAMRALKICWDARNQLFKKESSNTPNGPQKVSYIQNVYQGGKKDVEANPVSNISREGILSGQSLDD